MNFTSLPAIEEKQQMFKLKEEHAGNTGFTPAVSTYSVHRVDAPGVVSFRDTRLSARKEEV